MPHHLHLRIALGNFCQWLTDLVLRQTMTIISSSHSPWTQVLWTSLSHSHPSYYFSRLKCSAYGILLILFHFLVIFIGLTASPVFLNSPTWAGQATHWGWHMYVHPSVHTHTQKHTQQAALLCTAFYIPKFFIFEPSCSFQYSYSSFLNLIVWISL